jgi:hypothetical protein
MAYFEVREKWFKELSAVCGHLEDVVGDTSEQQECSSRLDVGADRLGVGPSATELDVRDVPLLEEVPSGSTVSK